LVFSVGDGGVSAASARFVQSNPTMCAVVSSFPRPLSRYVI